MTFFPAFSRLKFQNIIPFDLEMLYRFLKKAQKVPWQEIEIFKSSLMFTLVLKKDLEKRTNQKQNFGKLPEAYL